MSILDENIPSQWISRSLGSMGEFFGGVTSITKEDYGYGTPFLPFKNVFNNSKVDINALELMNIKEKDLIKRNCTYGDIFFTASSETDDEVAMSSVLLDNVKSLTYNGFCKRYRLHSFNELNPNFVRYFFRSKVFRGLIKQVVTGDVRFNISQETLSNLKISIPENIKEQKAIAKVLTAFDDKIELLQAQNKTLETMAQTIFAAWFGKYQMGDELPEGWRVAKFNEFVKSSIGGDYGKETIEGDYTEETICLRGTDLPDMKMGTPKKAPIRFLKASKLERCKLENGDIVVEISGGTENQSTGRAMYINEKILSSANHPMTCVNFCRIIRPLKLEYSYFLHSLFDYLYTRKVFFNLGKWYNWYKKFKPESIIGRF